MALAIGALVALALRGAREAIALAAASSRRTVALPRPSLLLPRPAVALAPPRRAVLALNLAGRAPPSSR